MKNLVLTQKLAKELNQVKGEWFLSYLKLIRAIAGNPFQISFKFFGKTLVMISPKTPKMGAFNTAWGFSINDLKYLDKICAFFEKNGMPPRFNVTPLEMNDQLGRALHQRGLFHADTAPVLYGAPTIAKLKKRFEVREIKKEEAGLFTEIFSEGFSGIFPLTSQMNLKQKNWHLILAYKNNRPAGAGILYTKNKIGNLAAACVLPEFRNEGCQKALIQYRINLAKKLKCKYILGSASFGSISQANQEELGFQIAYTSSIWKSIQRK